MSTYGPYSKVRASSHLLFTAGHVGVDPKTGSAPQGIAAQTEQALANLRDTLATEGLDLDSIVKTTVYLTSMDDFQKMNEHYITFFKEPRPARSTVAVKELPRIGKTPLLIEIEAIASSENDNSGEVKDV